MLNLVTNPLALIVTLYSIAEERLEREEKGATAVEYGLLVGLIAVAIIVTVSLLGGQLDDLFTTVSDELGGAGAGAATP